MSHKPSLIESVFILGCLAIAGIWLPWGLWTRAQTAREEDQYRAKLAWEKEHTIQLPGQAPREFRWVRIQWSRPSVLLRTDSLREGESQFADTMFGVSWSDALLELETPKAIERRRRAESDRYYLRVANGTRIKMALGSIFQGRHYSRYGQIAEGPHAGRAVFFDERLVRYEE